MLCGPESGPETGPEFPGGPEFLCGPDCGSFPGILLDSDLILLDSVLTLLQPGILLSTRYFGYFRVLIDLRG